MRSLLLALSFLTTLPVGARPGDPARALRWFPLVGGVIGMVLVAVDALARPVFPLPLRSVIVLAASWLLTGGLHLDGLADTFDGLAAGGDRKRALTVMRDSRIGSAGATALVLTLLLKLGALLELEGGVRSMALLMGPVIGRQAMVIMLSVHPYAREDGLAGGFFGHGKGELIWSLLLTAGLSLAAWYVWGGGVGLLVGATVALSGAWLLGRHIARRIGGMTGDTLGAVGELTEVLWLLAVTALRGTWG